MAFSYVPINGSWPGQTGYVAVSPIYPMTNEDHQVNSRLVYPLVNGSVSFEVAATDSIGNDVNGLYQFDINVSGGNSTSFSTKIPSSYEATGLSLNTQLPLNPYPDTSHPGAFVSATTGIPSASTVTPVVEEDPVTQIVWKQSGGAWVPVSSRTPRALPVILGGDGSFVQGTSADDTNGLMNPSGGAVVPVSNDTHYVEEPTVCQMPDGCLLIAHRWVSSGGSDTSGQGVIGLRTSMDGVTFSPVSTLAPTQIASNATLDCREPELHVLSDGAHVLLIYGTGSTTTGNPNGGNNIFGQIGLYTPGGNGTAGTVAWGAPFPMPTGLAGFDFPGAGRIAEPTPGTLIIPATGSATASTWDNQESVGYMVWTYNTANPGAGLTQVTTLGSGGNQTFVTIANTGTTNVAGGTIGSHVTGEICIGLCANGDWLALWRDSAGSQIWGSRLVGGTGGAAGTGVWTDPNTGSGGATGARVVFANLVSQPNLTVTRAGKIVFVSRGSNANSPIGIVAWSTTNGLTWNVTTTPGYELFDTRFEVTGWNYGAITELAQSPGHLFAVGAVGFGAPTAQTIIEARFITGASGMTPHGTLVGRGVISIDDDFYGPGVHLRNGSKDVRLTAGAASTDQTIGGVYRRNTGDVDFAGNALVPGGSASSPMSVWTGAGGGYGTTAFWQPAYLLRRPPEEYLPTAAIMANLVREMASQDLGATFLTSGVAMMSAISPPANTAKYQHIRVFTGATAAVGVTHAWFAMIRASYSTLAISADLGSVTINADSSIVFTLGSAINNSNSSVIYGMLVIVASTMPSVLGVPARSSLGVQPPILWGPSNSGLTTPVSQTYNAPAPTGAGGQFYFQMET